MESLKELAIEKLKNNSILEGGKPKSNKGGARPGAGRKKGGMNQSTIDRMAAKKEFQERVAAVADELFLSQYRLARGEAFLYHSYYTGKGKDRKKHVEVVTSVETIKEYVIDEGVTLNEDSGDDDSYYYISTKPANNLALEALLNRSFGRADEKLDITTAGDSINKGEVLPKEVVDDITAFMMEKTKRGGKQDGTDQSSSE